jgi:hypothetical protein
MIGVFDPSGNAPFIPKTDDFLSAKKSVFRQGSSDPGEVYFI